MKSLKVLLLLLTIIPSMCAFADESEINALKEACAKKDGVACSILARSLYKSTYPQEKSQGLYFHIKTCELSGSYSCGVAADDLMFGKTNNSDPKKAVEIAIAGCNLHDPNSCRVASYAYSNGKGVPTSAKSAFDYSYKACTLNDNFSCYLVALAYLKGKVVTINKESAIRFFTKSCNLSYAKACDKLQEMQN